MLFDGDVGRVISGCEIFLRRKGGRPVSVLVFGCETQEIVGFDLWGGCRVYDTFYRGDTRNI